MGEFDPNAIESASKQWAIAVAGGVTAIVAAHIWFDLVNLNGGQAHFLEFRGLGKAGKIGKLPNGKIAPKPHVGLHRPDLSYATFSTPKAVTFSAFDGCSARWNRLSVMIGVGFNRAYLTLWQGMPYFGPKLAYVGLGGFSAGELDVSYDLMFHGTVTVDYRDEKLAKPMGKVGAPIQLPDDSEIEFSGDLSSVQSKPSEHPKRIVLPDVLFDFDSARLKPEAEKALRKAEAHLNKRVKAVVRIEGHTDSVGRAGYNVDLSLARARAVHQWFIRHQVFGAEAFVVHGLGETRPVAPNGNPEGRRKNRRVEILYDYH